MMISLIFYKYLQKLEQDEQTDDVKDDGKEENVISDNKIEPVTKEISESAVLEEEEKEKVLKECLLMQTVMSDNLKECQEL